MTDPRPSELQLRIVPETGNPALLQSIISMWLEEGVIPRPEAERRVTEVVYAIVDSAENILGVTTAYAGQLPGGGEPVWLLRMFIRSSKRAFQGMAVKGALQWEILESTFRYLQSLPVSSVNLTFKGAVLVTENRKFWSERWQKALADRGWMPVGINGLGHRIHLRAFTEALLNS